MFKDKILGISILLSTAWHLFWIFSVGIIITPTVETSNLYQEVNFLGPLLEKTAFDFMTEAAMPQSETLYATSSLFIENAYLRPRGPDRKIAKKTSHQSITDRFFLVLRKYFQSNKEAPPNMVEEANVRYNKKSEIKPSSEIEGPAKYLNIVSKSRTPSVPRGLYGDSDEHIVKLKFFVSKNGIVRYVEPVISSGYTEIDFLAIRTLKKWRFAPKSDNKNVWGIISIKVMAR